jgi:hypothetical protein
MMFRRLCLALLLTCPIAANVYGADLESDLNALRAEYRAGDALNDQGVDSANASDFASACTSFHRAK